MPGTLDPFEAFRRARESEKKKPPKRPDRARYATEIARVLEHFDAPGDSPEVAFDSGISRGEVQSMVGRLFSALSSLPDAGHRERIVTFLRQFVSKSYRILEDAPSAGDSIPSLEYEIDYGDLFEFMLNPSLERLHHRR